MAAAAIAIAPDTAVVAASSEAAIVGTTTGDDDSSGAFEKSVNIDINVNVNDSNHHSGSPMDITNHPRWQHRFLRRERNCPGNYPDDSNTKTNTKTNTNTNTSNCHRHRHRHRHRQHDRTSITSSSQNGGVAKNKKDDLFATSDVLLLRHHRRRRRLNEQQQQQQRNRKLREQDQHHQCSKQECPSRTNTRTVNNDENKNDNNYEDSTEHVVQDEETERIHENNVDNDLSMPPPNEEMTNFVLLQRRNRVVSRLGVPVFGGLVAIQEERDNTPTQTEQQQPIVSTKPSNNSSTSAATAFAIADVIEVGIPTVPTYITPANTSNVLSPYNPDGYHFTNLPDGTPVYSSLLPFCSRCSIACDEDSKRDTSTAIRNHVDGDEEEEENDLPSLTPSQSLSTSQRFMYTIDDNIKKGTLFVDKSSIVPLAQTSCMVTTSTEEASENKATINDSTGDRYYDSSGSDEDLHQNDEHVAMTDFASSSIVSASSYSISSIAISTDINPKNGNGRLYEVDALHPEKKRNRETYPTPGSKKRCNDDDLLVVEGLVSEEDSPPPEREESSTNTNAHANTNTNTTRFKDIIGHQSIKLRLDEVLLPLALPASLSRTILKGVRSLPASILMYGPPGCGKTQLAKAVAGEAHAAFLSIGPSDILSKYVGESEEAVRSVFAEAVRLARNNNRGGGGNRCTVLFFDEIDALGQSRGVGTSNNNGNGTTGGGKAGPSIGKSNQSGGSGSGGSGDNSSRRILAELLIQLTKINTVHGTYDSSSLSIDSSEENCDEEEKDKYFEESRLDSREEEENMDANFFSSSDDTPAVICQDKMILEEEDKVRRQHKHNNDIENNNSIDNDNDNRTVRVIVVAATNRPEDCDPALIRRFAVQVQVGLPKAKDRKKMLKKSMEDINHTITKKQFSDLSLITDGWSGSDLQSLAREAAMAPVRECIRRAALMKRRRLFLLSHSSRGRKNKNKSSNDPCEEENSSESKSENESEGNKSNSSSNNNTNQCLKKSIARDNDDSFTRAQKRLLEEFRNLRPVNFRDYTKALAFWFGRMYNNLYDSPLAEFGWIEDSGGNHDTNDNVHTGGGSLNEHYDSSSDEDDEEEALSIEVTESNLDTERMVQHWDTVV